MLELFRQPSDTALGLLLKLHSRRPSDFVPLSRVTNLEEGRDFRADTPAKTKICKEKTLVLENSEAVVRKLLTTLFLMNAFYTQPESSCSGMH